MVIYNLIVFCLFLISLGLGGYLLYLFIRLLKAWIKRLEK